ncbi:hypothetical protein ES708_08948 [subsurface metagenome]
MRVLHCIEHFAEFSDPSIVRFFTGGDPFIAPGENSNAPLDTFFSDSPFDQDNIVGDSSSDCSDDDREQEKRKQYGDSDSD